VLSNSSGRYSVTQWPMPHHSARSVNHSSASGMLNSCVSWSISLWQFAAMFPSFHYFWASDLSFCICCHHYAVFCTETLRLALMVLVIQDIQGSNVDPQSLWTTLVTICTTCFNRFQSSDLTQRVVVCSSIFSYQIAIRSLNSIIRLVLVNEAHWFCGLLEVITALGKGNLYQRVKPPSCEAHHFNLASKLKMNAGIPLLFVQDPAEKPDDF